MVATDRKRNGTFQGSSPYQCQQGSYTYRSVLENAIGDTALLWDMLTGDHSWGGQLNDHSGGAGGAPLGVPFVQTGVIYQGSNDDHRFNSDGMNLEAYWAAHPVYIPAGESTFNVEMTLSNAAGDYLKLDVKDTSWSDAGTITYTYDGFRWSAEVTGLTESTLYFSLVKFDPGVGNPGRCLSYKCFFDRGGPAEGMDVPSGNDMGLSDPPIATKTLSGAEVANPSWPEEQAFAVNGSINAYMITKANETQNAIAEFITGSPAGGGDTLTLSPSGAADPTSSAFHDHSQSTYQNESPVDFPLCGGVLGAVKTSATDPSPIGDDWGAPGFDDAVISKVHMCEDIVYMPDFGSGVSNSRLKLVVLMSDPNNVNSGFSTPTLYARTRTSGGSATERSGTSTQLGSSRFRYATVGTTSGAGNRLDFTPDEANGLKFGLAQTKNTGAGDSVRVLGYLWYFEG